MARDFSIIGRREALALSGVRNARTCLWLLLLGACLVDGRSIAAEALVARCTTDGAWSMPVSIWGDHFLAFPLTSLMMIALCFQHFPWNERSCIASGLWRNVAMTVAMLPACGVAARTSSLVASFWATSVYGLTMALVAMCIAVAIERMVGYRKVKERIAICVAFIRKRGSAAALARPDQR